MKNITPDNAAGLNLESKCMILNSHWGPYSYKKTVRFKDGVTHTIRLDGENDVIFSDGCLVSGILDKSQYGAKAYGLVHSVYEIYGAEVAGRLLSILSRLFTKFLQHRAFTCRMDDLLLTPDADIARNEHLRKGQFYGHEAAVENFPALRDKTLTSEQRNAKLKVLLEEVLRDDTKMADLDTTVKKKMSGLTSAIASTSIPNGLHRRFPDNHMQTMVMSGAKGSAVNARQISCSLGQTELEGRRVPVMVSGKTLPSFKPLETAAIAGGYIASRFLTGIKPQEFYFHCMAGREGLIDTAVKTSRSGYLQRCLIKHLEGIRVHYDNTVRGSDSAVYQFLYGGDGLDVTKQMHLKHFDFVLKNSYSIVQRTNPKAISQRVNNEEAVSYMKKALKKPEKYAPTMSVYPPSRYLGSTSEGFARALDDYVTKNTGKTLRGKTEADDARVGRAVRYSMKSKTFRNLANAMYLKSLVEPGEAVGLLASQGVGEPSTQMTLNTFHFAGHGAANVTLGIPRLREIVMTASRKPKTPTMTLPISQGLSRDRIESFCKKASRLLLSEVVDCVTVTEQLITEHGSRQKLFSVKINLFPKAQCQKEYLVETEELMSALGREFPLVLRKELTSELKKLGENLKSQSANIGKGRIVRENDEGGRISGDQDVDDDEGTTRKKDDDEASEIGDGDRDSAKKLKQGKQQATYDDSSESDDGMKEDETRGMDEDTIEAAIQGDDSSDSDDELIGDGDWADTMTDIQSTFMERCQPWATKFNFERDGSKCTFNLKFTSDTPKLLLVGIIERACTKTVIRQIPDILRCREFIPEKKSEGPKFMTEGCNFTGLWEYCQDEGDLNLVESNHIYAVLCAYGVEYARATIIREISNVFDVYNIKVDVRHLTLIADYMTFDGGYRPFSRRGIATHSSPLLKASYETTAAFLSDATLHGDFDTLTSPSGSIVLGRPATSGTGMFGIVTPLQHHSDEMDV
ncbi:hypothetical protein FRC03_000140 [Tulasnella sp. 419]|nr:hypothetical protein FRC03_000140 [Tulasnella sp. 419]